jgi:dTDP-glucose 4,6-dehydratase
VLYNSFNSWGWLDTPPADIRKELDVFTGDIPRPRRRQKGGIGLRCGRYTRTASIAIPDSDHSPDT